MYFLPVIGKLLIVFLLSGAFGFNRQRAHKPIGFGTFIYVSIGSCALAITAIELSGENPLPLLSAIVTGIGFLGAGAMIKTTDKIFGVTTAASIWLFAIFGMLIGVGEYNIAIVMYLLVWIVLGIDLILQYRGIGSYQRKAIVITSIRTPEHEIRTQLKQACHHCKLLEITVDVKDNVATRHYLIEGKDDSITKLPHFLNKIEGLQKCTIQ